MYPCKSLQMHKIMRQKVIIFSDFVYVSTILTLPSMICVGKRNGGFQNLVSAFQ